MDDLISRQAAIDKMKKRLFETAFNNAGIKQNIDETLVDVAENRLENWFNELPSTQPEHKTWHWIPVTNGRGGHQCDKCGCYAPSYQSGTEWLSNFCPECNADMRGDKHETD